MDRIRAYYITLGLKVALLRVLVDGIQIGAVSTEGLDVLAADLGGSKVDEEFSTLGLHGGAHPPEGESTHLIWINERAVLPGQKVRVEISSLGATSHNGKTIDELLPDEEGDGDDDEDESPLSREAVVESLAKRPRLRTRYQFTVQSSVGEACVASTSEDEHGFGVSFLWNSHRPDRVSASLHTYGLEQLRERSAFTYHWRTHLHVGEWAEVTIEA